MSRTGYFIPSVDDLNHNLRVYPRGYAVHEVDELACEEPLYVVPAGWEHMTRDELDAWAIKRQAARGSSDPYAGVTHYDAPVSVNVPSEPKGDWPSSTLPTSRAECPYVAGSPCPMCGCLLEVDSWYRTEAHCLDCGFSVVDIAYLDDAGPESDPEWRGYGNPQPYRDDELAASLTVWYHGEAMCVQEPQVTRDEFPYAFDIPVVPQQRAVPLEVSKWQ